VARLGLSSGEDARADGDEDALAALQAAEVERRLRFPDEFRRARRSAHLDGFSLHAGVRVHANDREGLERLCRYALRPPLALRRLSRGPDGRLVYRMKRPRGGSLFLVLTPDELLAKVATLVPPPRSHALRYHGVFAPNAKDRRRVVPAAGDRPGAEAAGASRSGPAEPAPERPAAGLPATEGSRGGGRGAFRLEPPDPPAGSRPSPRYRVPSPRYRVPWAELLRKVFAIDVLECPGCAGRLEVIAFIAEPRVAKRILDHLGMDSQGPPLGRARAPDGPEAAGDPVPDYSASDPIYDE
jgi:hypothetical protein